MRDRDLKARDVIILSIKFPGHYYELAAKLGVGGVGVVYGVLLKDMKTNQVT